MRCINWDIFIAIWNPIISWLTEMVTFVWPILDCQRRASSKITENLLRARYLSIYLLSISLSTSIYLYIYSPLFFFFFFFFLLLLFSLNDQLPSVKLFTPNALNAIVRRESYKKMRTKAYSMVGSPDYMAVELLRGTGYDFTADWWSLVRMEIYIYSMHTIHN